MRLWSLAAFKGPLGSLIDEYIFTLLQSRCTSYHSSHPAPEPETGLTFWWWRGIFSSHDLVIRCCKVLNSTKQCRILLTFSADLMWTHPWYGLFHLLNGRVLKRDFVWGSCLSLTCLAADHTKGLLSICKQTVRFSWISQSRISHSPLELLCK